MTDSEQVRNLEDELDIREILDLLWKEKLTILKLLGLGALISLIVSLNIENRYRSTALLAPKFQESSGVSSLVGQYAGLANVAGIDIGAGQKGTKIQVAKKTLESFYFFPRGCSSHLIRHQAFFLYLQYTIQLLTSRVLLLLTTLLYIHQLLY